MPFVLSLQEYYLSQEEQTLVDVLPFLNTILSAVRGITQVRVFKLAIGNRHRKRLINSIRVVGHFFRSGQIDKIKDRLSD